MEIAIYINKNHLLKRKKMRKIRLIGDAEITGTGRAYQQKITLKEAQEMCDLLCSTEHFSKIYIKLGKQTLLRHGKINIKQQIMTLNKPSEGIVLHELSHLVDIHHGKAFKTLQTKLYQLWYGINNE